MRKLTTLDDVFAEMEPGRKKRVLAEAKRIALEYDALKALRRSRSKTQVQIAKELSVTQPYVAKLEQKSDLMLSVLRNYVRSIGGDLELFVVFPDSTRIALTGLGAVGEVTPGKMGSRPKRQARTALGARARSKRPAA